MVHRERYQSYPCPQNTTQGSLTYLAGDSCSSIENDAPVTASNFLKWNPAISSDCSSGLWADYAYCTGTSDDSLTRTSVGPGVGTPTATSTSQGGAPAPGPTQTNSIIDSCNKYDMTRDGDYCSLFAQRNGIAAAQLYAWNRVLGPTGENCESSFWLGYDYCVGIQA